LVLIFQTSSAIDNLTKVRPLASIHIIIPHSALTHLIEALNVYFQSLPLLISSPNCLCKAHQKPEKEAAFQRGLSMAMGVWKGRLRYEKNNNSDDNYMEIKSDQAAVATVDGGTSSTSVWSARLRKASIASSRKTSGSTARKVDSINNTSAHSKVEYHSKELTDE